MKHAYSARLGVLGVIPLLAMISCSPALVTPTTAPTSPSTPVLRASPSQPPSATPIPSSTRLPPTASSTPVPAPTLALCSPLEGITLSQLPQILQEPLLTPHPGQDDGHHGDDFAFYRFGSITNMEGLPVHSVLPGVVAAQIADRLPYGNMVIIETPLDAIPLSWRDALHLPTPSPAMSHDSRMQNCSEEPASMPETGPGRSLYLLYAHLRQPSILKPDERVDCGASIGEVGNTGLSGNPHLHLEVRVGPSGARFPAMAYYDPRANEAEFSAYCTWRVSQLFQLLDPLSLLSLQP